MREVCESGDVKHDAVDAVPAECLGTHLNGNRLNAALAHEGKERVHLARFGRREAAHHDVVADVSFGRRREPGDSAHLLQDSLEQVRDAGFAVGTGSCKQQRHRKEICGRRSPVSRRVGVCTRCRARPGAVDPRRNATQDRARVCDHEHRDVHTGGSCDGRARGIRDHRNGACVCCRSSELRTVLVRTGDGDEDIAGTQIGGGEGHARKFDAPGVADHAVGEAFGKRGEFADGRALRAEHRGDTSVQGGGLNLSRCGRFWRLNVLIRAGEDRVLTGRRGTRRKRGYRMRVSVILFIIGILIIVVGLGVSIALHEIGHLVPAKKFGVRVGQYMIGFGPTLWSRRIGETEYGVKALPLGGYISMAGMYPPSPGADADASGGGARARAGAGFFNAMVQDARAANDETLEGADDRVFYRLPVYKRIIIMLGGPVMNLLFAGVLFTLLFSGIGIAGATTTVASLSECVVPAGSAQTECQPGDTPAPANAAGFVPGDVIVSVGGTEIATFAEASAIIRDSPGVPLQVVVARDGVPQTLTLVPTLAEREKLDDQGMPVIGADGNPEMVEVGFAGIGAATGLIRQPVWTGVEATGENVAAVAGIIVQLPEKLYNIAVSLFTGDERDPNGPLSVVGVGIIAGEVAAMDAPVMNRIGGVIGLLGSLNIVLFVFNLLPLLPLDGGHVVVALWEGVKRLFARIFGLPAPKPADATKLVPITFVVVVALVIMGGLLIAADIFNPVDLFG